MSRLRIKSRTGGFTLLEIMIVVTIMAIVVGIGLPRFQSIFDVQIKSAIRRLVGTVRFTFNEAAMKKGFYRLFYDINENQYYVQRLAVTGEFLEEETSMLKKQTLPAGIMFEDVVTIHAGKIDEGVTFTQFFPNGYAERTVIHLKDAYETQYSLVIHPLTGRVEVFDRYIDIVEGQIQ